MWLRDELRKIEKYLVDFLKASIARAEQDISLLMPGYGKYPLKENPRVDWKLMMTQVYASAESAAGEMESLVAFACGSLCNRSREASGGHQEN